MSMLCVCLCAHACYIVIYIHLISKHQTNVNALSYGSMGAWKSVFGMVTVTYFRVYIYAKIGAFLLCLHRYEPPTNICVYIYIYIYIYISVCVFLYVQYWIDVCMDVCLCVWFMLICCSIWLIYMSTCAVSGQSVSHGCSLHTDKSATPYSYVYTCIHSFKNGDIYIYTYI